MKKTIIKDRMDLIHGLYIRAVVNCHGKFWIEFVRVSGKQFKRNILQEWQVRSPSRKYSKGLAFIHDLGVGRRDHTRLFRFTNRDWLALDALVKAGNVFDFIEFITGTRIPQSKRDIMLEDWMEQKLLDDQLLKSMMDSCV